ncbi:MAG TPA: hypothetical protein ENH86_00335 [Candidatus Jorgensenbacteria bacterium]|nr:hypothetical protein [Candidatus Jorgensenbacteria bacterium]
MRKCELCEKSHTMGGKRKLLRGHYNPVNKHYKRKANLQRTILPSGKRALICTQCLKTLSKKKK